VRSAKVLLEKRKKLDSDVGDLRARYPMLSWQVTGENLGDAAKCAKQHAKYQADLEDLKVSVSPTPLYRMCEPLITNPCIKPCTALLKPLLRK
jgi:hypothetical protein